MPRYARLMAVAALLAGCSSSAGKQSEIPPPQGPQTFESTGGVRAPLSAPCASTASIYVSSSNILYHHNATEVANWCTGEHGNVPPNARIKGERTRLAGLSGIAVDTSGSVYVANTFSNGGLGSITVYAAGKHGNVAPVQEIGGSTTGISMPNGVAVDTSRNMYVANGGGSVTVYGAGASGNVAPIRTIAGSRTRLHYPSGIALDATGNIFVTNDNNSITVYGAGANGNVEPMRRIKGSKTGLDQPVGIALDAGGNAYVVNSFNDSVTAYAAGASGNAAPMLVIAGSNTKIGGPEGVALDAGGNIYVTSQSESGSITIYAAGANGNVEPIRGIGGGKTTLGYYIFGIAVGRGPHTDR